MQVQRQKFWRIIACDENILWQPCLYVNQTMPLNQELDATFMEANYSDGMPKESQMYVPGVFKMLLWLLAEHGSRPFLAGSKRILQMKHG